MPSDHLPLCECRWLEKAAHDPACPVEFDERLNEYNLRNSDGGMMSIYHCPFFGGRAPKSLRAKLFAAVPWEETARLHELTRELKSEAEVRALLGEPTKIHDPGVGMSKPQKEGEPGEISVSKSLIYEGFSDVANIRVNVNRYGKVNISFSGKYVGLPDREQP